MSTIQSSASRRRRFGALGLAVLVGASGALVTAAPMASPAGAVPVTGPTSANIVWGIKDGFRSYIGEAGTTTSNGASQAPSAGVFTFTGGSAATVTGPTAASVGGSGTVQFGKHDFGSGNVLDVTISDPRITVSGTTGTIVVDAVSRPYTGNTVPNPAVTYDDVAVATLDLSSITPTNTATARTWTNVPATLTAAGAPVFAGFYPAGSALDPVTFGLSWTPQVTYSKASGINPAGESITVSGTGFNPEANTTTGQPPLPAGSKAGVYVTFGKYQNVWQPSAGAASSTRQTISQMWAMPQATKTWMETNFPSLASQLTLLSADGSFSTTVLVKVDATKSNPNYGIVTYAAGGAPANAGQESFQAVSFATTTSLSVPSVTATGSATQISATVVPSLSGGTVTFSSNGTPIGSAPVVAGVATLSTSFTPAGVRNLDAAFSGAPGFDASATSATAISVVDGITSPIPSVTIGDKTVVETGTSQAVQVPLALNFPSATAVSVNVATADATALAGSDYTTVPSTLVTFAPGETSKTASVTVLGDGIGEKAEKFSVNLSTPSGLTIGDTAGTVNILDEDATISVYVSDASVTEGNSGTSNATFTVSLSRAVPAGTVVTVPVVTANGTAQEGSDFTFVPTTLTFNPTETSKTVTVPVSGDAAVEKNETFSLKATGIVGAISGDAAGKGTIVNDDGTPGVAPLPSLTVADQTIVEGNSGTSNATVTVKLAPASTSAVTVNVATANSTAVAGSDYTAVSTMLTFAAGETTKTITVPIVGDVAPEKTEKLSVKLSGASGAVIGDNLAALNVLDNDAPLSISVADVVATEGTTATFVVALSAPVPAGSTVTISAATEDGTAKSALGDYATAGSSLTFAAGEQYKTVTVTVGSDAVTEGNETFKLRLSSAAGASLADALAVATIVNDLAPIVAS